MQFTAGDHLAYVDDVLDRAFDGQALRAALGQTRASTSAAETVLQLTRAAGNKGVLTSISKHEVATVKPSSILQKSEAGTSQSSFWSCHQHNKTTINSC